MCYLFLETRKLVSDVCAYNLMCEGVHIEKRGAEIVGDKHARERRVDKGYAMFVTRRYCIGGEMLYVEERGGGWRSGRRRGC